MVYIRTICDRSNVEILSGIIKISTKFSENPAEFISNAKSGKITSTTKKLPVKRQPARKTK